MARATTDYAVALRNWKVASNTPLCRGRPNNVQMYRASGSALYIINAIGQIEEQSDGKEG